MIRFMADADLRHAIVRGCLHREPTIDFLWSNNANLEGVPDPEVLAIAAEQGRILISHDLRSMPWHFADFVQARGSSPGVIIVPQYMAVGAAIEVLLTIWGASDAGEWQNWMVKIPL